MGCHAPHRPRRRGRSASGDRRQGPDLNEPLTPRSFGEIFRCHWWATVAHVARATGDLGIAEDSVQEACSAALTQWPVAGMPENPGAWLWRVAHHKAIDRIRREARRADKEGAALLAVDEGPLADPRADSLAGSLAGPLADALADDELALIFLCCHPALSREAQVALTLRAVSGLSTAEIAAAFFVPEATMSKRLVRAKRKIRESAIPFRLPSPDQLATRLDAVLRVVYLVFTQGHWSTAGNDLIRPALCDSAIRLARGLYQRLPAEPEVTGLLALLLLTDARREARRDRDGHPVILEEQDRDRWDRGLIAEGEALLDTALRRGRSGPYQLWAAIAACHSTAPTAEATDWPQIAALYQELLRYEPTPVVEANRAVAVGMGEGLAAGLALLDALAVEPPMAVWPPLQVARADLLCRLGREEDAIAAYQKAMDLGIGPTEQSFIDRRIDRLRNDLRYPDGLRQ